VPPVWDHVYLHENPVAEMWRGLTANLLYLNGSGITVYGDFRVASLAGNTSKSNNVTLHSSEAKIGYSPQNPNISGIHFDFHDSHVTVGIDGSNIAINATHGSTFHLHNSTIRGNLSLSQIETDLYSVIIAHNISIIPKQAINIAKLDVINGGVFSVSGLEPVAISQCDFGHANIEILNRGTLNCNHSVQYEGGLRKLDIHGGLFVISQNQHPSLVISDLNVFSGENRLSVGETVKNVTVTSAFTFHSATAQLYVTTNLYLENAKIQLPVLTRETPTPMLQVDGILYLQSSSGAPASVQLLYNEFDLKSTTTNTEYLLAFAKGGIVGKFSSAAPIQSNSRTFNIEYKDNTILLVYRSHETPVWVWVAVAIVGVCALAGGGYGGYILYKKRTQRHYLPLVRG